MGLSLARLHHAEEALGVDDLAGHLDVTEKLGGRRRDVGRGAGGLERAGHQLEHAPERALDARRLEADPAAVEPGGVGRRAVLSFAHQESAARRVLVDQHRVGALEERPLDCARGAELEGPGIERRLEHGEQLAMAAAATTSAGTSRRTNRAERGGAAGR